MENELTLYKEKTIDIILKSDIIDTLSDNSRDVLNEALFCWLNEDYLYEVPKERVNKVCQVLTLLKQSEYDKNNKNIVQKLKSKLQSNIQEFHFVSDIEDNQIENDSDYKVNKFISDIQKYEYSDYYEIEMYNNVEKM